MAYFKSSGTSSRGNDQLRHGEGIALKSPVTTEQRIANAVIQDKLETKDTPLSRMTSYKTSVVYYQQNVTGRNDYVINTGNLSTVDVNKNAFYKIKDFVIICDDPLNVNLEKNDGNSSLMGDGTATILPKTIKPLINDYFIMNTLNNNNLYRITEVNKTSIEKDSAYKITYQLVEEDSKEQLDKLEHNTIDEYIFIYAHVGTSFRTIFKDNEYEYLEKLERMYMTMGELYNEFFYNVDKNTYILSYNGLDIKDEHGVPINESRMNNIHPWTIISSDKNGKSKVEPPKLNDSECWYGSLMYDRMLIEFICKNKLFSNINRKVYRVTQLQEDLERWYSGTIFYAIEHQTSNRLKYEYIIPSPITRVNMSSRLGLYGVVSLEPMAGHIKGCIPMIPSILFDYIKNDRLEGRYADPKLNIYESMIDLICETIGIYINKKDDIILERLLMLSDKLDEFSELSIRDQNAFYLFPMLSYVIQKTMDKLSDPNFGVANFLTKK